MTPDEIEAYQAAWNKDVLCFLFYSLLCLFLLWIRFFMFHEFEHEKPLKNVPTQKIKYEQEYKPLGQRYGEDYNKRKAAYKATLKPKSQPRKDVFEWQVKYKGKKFKTKQIKK